MSNFVSCIPDLARLIRTVKVHEIWTMDDGTHLIDFTYIDPATQQIRRHQTARRATLREAIIEAIDTYQELTTLPPSTT